MKRSFIVKRSILLVIILFAIVFVGATISYAGVGKIDTNPLSQLKATQLGIGGGGALFEPAISPFDSNNMLVISDMGGIYITHNKGENWERKNLYGTVISAKYDPNREGVLYAGGSGLYRSHDNGDNFELIFPRKDDIIARLTQNENGLQYYFTHSKQYDKNKFVKSILIDPEDSDHIFVLCYAYRYGLVFESTDNGESFNQILSYEKSKSSNIQYDLNELVYRRETKELFVVNDERVINYNLITKQEKIEYTSPLGLVDVASVYENNQTYFIFIEKTNELAYTNTIVYYTNDFQNKVDITDSLTGVKPTSFNDVNYGEVTYKYNFKFIDATSLNNIFVTNKSSQSSSSIKPYPYNIDGIIRYHDGVSSYIFGNPFRNHNYMTTRLWADGNTSALGIAASKQREGEFIFTTLCGVVYSPDSEHLYPRYSKVTEGTYPNAKYVTNGIDEQTTYGVREDPFHKDVILLLNTDLGLIRSEDNGKSWSRTNSGIPNKWVNTVYDLIFDEREENVVYSLWSGRHDAPYYATNETDGRYGGFAISYDGGITWDANYSSGIPENAIPVKMGIIYPDDSKDATIYVATFNEGFFVSYDSGESFTEINEGINRVSYKNEDGYQYILASDIEVKDGHIFGITARSNYNSSTQPGELYEFIDGKWNKIDLPKNLTIPRDIYYHDGILYISATATAVWDYKNGTDFNNYGGGVHTYQNGEFTQIFDESISTTSVQIDSKETIYVSDTNGNIYRKEVNKDYQKIYDSYHYVSKGIELSKDGDYLYLASFGGGLLKLENLNVLYHHDCKGGKATCLKRAICEICGKEYGKLDPNNHELSSTHIINQKDATCDEEGYTGDIVYDCCNVIKEKGWIIPKLKNNEEEIIIPEKPKEEINYPEEHPNIIIPVVTKKEDSTTTTIIKPNTTTTTITKAITTTTSSIKTTISTNIEDSKSNEIKNNNTIKSSLIKKYIIFIILFLLLLITLMVKFLNRDK